MRDPRIDGAYHRRRLDWWQGISRVKLIVSLIVGLLTIPGLAVGVLALTKPQQPAPLSPETTISIPGTAPPTAPPPSTRPPATTVPAVTRERYLQQVSQVCDDAESERQALIGQYGEPPASPPGGDTDTYVVWNRLYLAIDQRMLARWRTIEPAPADRTGLAHLQAQLAQGLAQVAQAIDAYSRGDWPTGNAGERAAHQTLSAYDHAAPAFGLPRTCLT